VREFIRFVLSREGQQIVQKAGIYSPLPATTIREQLKKARLTMMQINRTIIGAICLASLLMLWTDHAVAQQSQPTRNRRNCRRLRGGAQGSDGHAGEPAGLHQEIRLERPAATMCRRTNPPERCASPATTMSATRLWAIGGRKPSKIPTNIKIEYYLPSAAIAIPRLYSTWRHRHQPRAQLL